MHDDHYSYLLTRCTILPAPHSGSYGRSSATILILETSLQCISELVSLDVLRTVILSPGRRFANMYSGIHIHLSREGITLGDSHPADFGGIFSQSYVLSPIGISISPEQLSDMILQATNTTILAAVKLLLFLRQTKTTVGIRKFAFLSTLRQFQYQNKSIS